MSIRRVSDRKLSLWQSAVLETVNSITLQGKEELTPEATARLMSHPYVEAAAEHVSRVEQRDGRRLAAPPTVGVRDEFEELVYVSQLNYEIAEALSDGNEDLANELKAECRKFATCDWKGWAQCLEVYLEYFTKYGTPLYRDWRKEGGSIRNYGVIEHRLPANGKVALIGDWATGLPDAKALVKDIVTQHRPDVIIHLGDIYYSGTPKECTTFVNDLIDEVRNETGINFPFLTIPGNHDYYAFGYGYYPLIDGLNKSNKGWRQEASYFCLRTADNKWQILGMDTGRHDYHVSDAINPIATGPHLEPSEVEWHRDKLEEFPGSTILLSHHQLYSQNSRIKGRLKERGWINDHLYTTFRPYFDRIQAWFWGHEHNLLLFKDGIHGLKKGRLVGCSGYEAAEHENPYTPVNEEFERMVPYKHPFVELPAKNGYYHHGYAILSFGADNSGAVDCRYFAFPSWGTKDEPQDPHGTQLFKETIDPRPTPPPPGGDPVKYGEKIYLQNNSGEYISTFYEGAQYYPRLADTGAVALKLSGRVDEVVRDGDVLHINTTERKVGEYYMLGAWTTNRNLYYYTPGYDVNKQGWKLEKFRDEKSPDNVIRYGDKVTIYNMSWKTQKMCKDGEYLTTSEKAQDFWYIRKVDE